MCFIVLYFPLCPPNLLLFRVSHAMRGHQTFICWPSFLVLVLSNTTFVVFLVLVVFNRIFVASFCIVVDLCPFYCRRASLLPVSWATISCTMFHSLDVPSSFDNPSSLVYSHDALSSCDALPSRYPPPAPLVSTGFCLLYYIFAPCGMQ